MKKRNSWLLALFILVISVAIMLPAAVSATTAPNSSPVSVSFVIQADWDNGCVYNVTIRNYTPNIIMPGWILSWSFIGDQKLLNIWNGTVTISGSEVIYKGNFSIPANGSASFGFTVAGTGRGVTNVRFNGQPVDNGGPVIW